LWSKDKDFWSEDKDKDKDLWSENKDKDKDFWSEDKDKDKDLWSEDKDLLIGRRGSLRARTFLEDNNTGLFFIVIIPLWNVLSNHSYSSVRGTW